ncbi:TPA: glutamate-1-semialdehyde 2,1-aminomutase [Legionella pneumophila]|nr:glutamate-1-semialdehyde 2,1-aminomutase [Legionella pneumophila]HAT2115962.1 glutamate-1-semialdehyde 2,1-aminomutase [Legionella pneumophila]HAT8721272.1 glutamate-1-semialdehyde 2,1-aminomutase [Legionella pneumophila]
MNFNKSMELAVIAKRNIPAGTHTYSKGSDQFPQLSPKFIVRGKGCQVWDIDGNQYTDWGMGLRSVILGHAHPEILNSVKEELENGSNFILPSPIENKLAEKLIDLIPCAEMVKFAKNGSDVTTAAVKLARAYTGKNIVVRCLDHPFFSVDDWFIGDTLCDAGIPDAIKALTKNFRYNDIESFEHVLNQYSDDIACVIMEIATTHEPKPGFLKKIRQLTEEKGIILIFDEIISGFRFHPKGAQYLYNVTPDLATFGKSIANGFSLSALVGKRNIMELGGLEHSKPRVFLLSTTNGGETHSIAAALKSIELMEDGKVSKHIWSLGEVLISQFNSLSKEFGLENYIFMDGIPCSPYQIFKNKNGQIDLALRSLFLQETIQQGILAPYFAISASHDSSHIDQYLQGTRIAMRKMSQAIAENSTEGLLIGTPVKPVFRKYN